MNSLRKINSKDCIATDGPVTKMFTRINSNGNSMQKVSPIAQPVVSASTRSSNGRALDASHLDFLGIEEFLSILREGTESNDRSLRNASVTLAAQLKESRTLLSMAPYLSSNDGVMNILDRLMDTAYFILNAENVYLLQPDSNGTDYIITHTHADGVVGMKITIQDIASGKTTIHYTLLFISN